jgi:hypothetical protein
MKATALEMPCAIVKCDPGEVSVSTIPCTLTAAGARSSESSGRHFRATVSHWNGQLQAYLFIT